MTSSIHDKIYEKGLLECNVTVQELQEYLSCYILRQQIINKFT